MLRFEWNKNYSESIWLCTMSQWQNETVINLEEEGWYTYTDYKGLQMRRENFEKTAIESEE